MTDLFPCWFQAYLRPQGFLAGLVAKASSISMETVAAQFEVVVTAGVVFMPIFLSFCFTFVFLS